MLLRVFFVIQGKKYVLDGTVDVHKCLENASTQVPRFYHTRKIALKTFADV